MIIKSELDLYKDNCEFLNNKIDKVVEYIKENFCNKNNLDDCWHEDMSIILKILLGDGD